MHEPANRPVLWMFLGAFSFAAMGAFTSTLGGRCDWLLIALVRVVFMFVSTAILAHSAGIRLTVWSPPTLWLRSLAGSFSLVCNFFALTRLPLADVFTLANAYPLWIVVLSALVLKQSPTRLEVLGVCSGVLGVVLIQRPLLAGNQLAVVVALVSSVSAALAMLGLHRLKGVDPRAVVAHFAGVASLFAGAGLVLRWQNIALSAPDATTWLMLLGVGVTGTVGQFFLTKAYAAGVPTRIAVISLTQVIFGMIFDVVLRGRSLTPLSLLGFLLVLAPTVWVTSRPEQGSVQLATRRRFSSSSISRTLQNSFKFDRPAVDGEDTAP
jgi:drug/metabolite transporter (DMT)-like permease